LWDETDGFYYDELHVDHCTIPFLAGLDLPFCYSCRT